VSLIRDRTFVARTPAAEKARSASTDVAGMVHKYPYTCSRQRPLLPLLANTATSALIEFVSCLLAEAREDALALRPDSGKDIDSFMAISSCCFRVGSEIAATSLATVTPTTSDNWPVVEFSELSLIWD
jgi:hypothetical protein